MKIDEMISIAKMANTSNPLIIYDFYDTLERASTLSSLSETYLEPCLTSKMRPFAKMINGFQPSNIFAKSSSLDVWLGCEYATEYVYQSAINQIVTKPLKYTSSIVIDAFLGDMSGRSTDTGVLTLFKNLSLLNVHFHLWTFKDKIDS